MYTQNIIFIERFLSKELEEAIAELESFKETMIKKYEDDWYESHLSKEESNELHILRSNKQDLLAALDDFKNHSW